jgi:thiamine-phosphate pyrophosphorylase
VARIPLLYLVTDRRLAAGRSLVDVVDVVHAALDGGADGVQLREKDLLGAELLRLASALRELTARYRATFLVNDRIDVALAAGADGVHLPRDGFPVADARRLIGPGRLIGVSTHAPAEVAAAASDGADFAVFGPVYDTPSKAAFGPPRGIEGLRAARAASGAFPLLAIGGITAERVGAVRAAGAAGVAVVAAIMAADDPARAPRELAAALRRRTAQATT